MVCEQHPFDMPFSENNNSNNNDLDANIGSIGRRIAVRFHIARSVPNIYLTRDMCSCQQNFWYLVGLDKFLCCF